MSEWGFKEIATLLLVILVVIAAIGIGLYQNGNLSKKQMAFLNNITSFLGLEKDVDYSRLNKVAEAYFNNPDDSENDIVAKLEKCKKSSLNDCGCDLDLSAFDENHVISVNINKWILYDKREYEKTTSNVAISEFSFVNANCIWKNSNENIINNPVQIIFKKENEVIVPKVYYKVNWGFDYEENLASVELYKKDGKLCWVNMKTTGFTGEVSSCV